MRRLASGFTAAARRASPTFVNRKKSPSRTTEARQTQMIPMSWIEKATPARWIGRVENGLGNLRTAPPQIQLVRPLTRIRSPIVTITTVRTERPSTGRMTTRSTATPPANAQRSVRQKAGQNEMPWWVNVHAR